MNLLIISNKIKLLFPKTFYIVKKCFYICGFRGLYFTKKINKDDLFVRPDFSLNQFFFTKKTVLFFIENFDNYYKICCLCTPRLAHEWYVRGRKVALLDIDKRFSYLPGYIFFDMRKPRKIDENFDLIICDPPFYLSANEIYNAFIFLTNEFNTSILIIFPLEREDELFLVFKKWQLKRILSHDIEWNNIRKDYQDIYGLYTNI